MTDTGITFEELRKINETIRQIYEGPNEQTSLPDFLTEFLLSLRKQIYFDKGNFMFYEYDAKRNYYSVNAFPHIGWDSSDIELYMNAYAQMDDILPVMTEKENIVILNRNILRKKLDTTTKYYTEFVQPVQLFNSIHANCPLQGSDTIFAKISIFRNDTRRPFLEKDVEIIKVYQPHLSKLINEQLLSNEISDADEFAHLLESFHSVGICVLDKNFAITTVNDTYRNLTLSDDTNPVADENLTRHIQSLCEAYHKAPERDNTELHEITANGKSYYVEILCYRETLEKYKYVCFVYDYSGFLLLKLSRIRAQKRLTNREYEILYLILKKGYSTEELAEHLTISLSTAKKHISAIYRKLGVSG
ncbi:MAG: LuxR C-terminal-related transcriptional regulator, partial [Clostridiales Family XIII bacterium]|nr:LuxR C-terminal-related transcriptional regulator [Clostridiales Family XIII bacterium]